MTRMLIVSDSEAMTRLLFEVLGDHPKIQIVAKTWDADEAIKAASQLNPDLVVIASGVAIHEDVLSLAQSLYNANPSVIIVVAGTLSESFRRELLDVCAIPLESDITDLPWQLEELIPDLASTPQERAASIKLKRPVS